MAGRSGGISGLAVALATAGGILLYTGVRGVSIRQGLQDIMAGRTPGGSALASSASFTIGERAGGVSAVPANGGTTSPAPQGAHPEIAQAASRYLGIPYRWGEETPEKGFDCSGLVTYVLHHDLGVNLPNNTHTVAHQFWLWESGAPQIPRKDCAAGDLVCWAGHVGIAVSDTHMINAPRAGAVVRIDKIWTSPAPVVRRVKFRKVVNT